MTGVSKMERELGHWLLSLQNCYSVLEVGRWVGPTQSLGKEEGMPATGP